MIAEYKDVFHQALIEGMDKVIDTYDKVLNVQNISIPKELELPVFDEIVRSAAESIKGTYSSIAEELKTKLQDKDFIEKVKQDVEIKLKGEKNE